MPYQIVLTDIAVKDFVIFKETTDEGVVWRLGVRYVLKNDAGESRSYKKTVDLTEQQMAYIMQLIKPCIQELSTELDVVVPSWAKDDIVAPL